MNYFLRSRSGVRKFDPDQPRDELGRWSETGTTAKEDPGGKRGEKTFLAYRLGRSPHVEGHTAGNAESVASLVSNYEQIGTGFREGDQIQAHEVTVGLYGPGGGLADPYNETADAVGRMVAIRDDRRVVSYLFPKDSKAYSNKPLGYVTVNMVRQELARNGYKSFTEAGTNRTADVIRRLLSPVVGQGRQKYRS